MSGERESWRKACIILVLVSIAVGLIQRSSYQFLDPTFEVSVFHLPTVISLIIYYYLTRKQSPGTDPEQDEPIVD
ncbi:MAG TPA: hypothetical protein VMW22_01655 [Candidatus Desulfaltia sp.]|nr:hypothetical protein [Candidatus Desulfaltia sp.]